MNGVAISVRDLVAEISAAFQSSPLEIALIFGMIAALLGILIGYWIHSRRQERRRREELDRERYEAAIAKHNLTEEDQELLEELAQHLEQTGKKHVLLSNKAIYNAAARRLLAEDPSRSDAVSALRLRLGFRDAHPDRPVASTTEIPVGASVLLVPEQQHPIGARVTGQEEDAMVVRASAPAERIAAARPVRVLFHNRAGVFAFDSSVTSTSENEARLDHSETPEQIQRRRYYRHPIRRPAYIRPSGSEAEPDGTEFLEIGGGGASMFNPYGKYAPGDDLEISFSPDSDRSLSVAGTVIRTSQGGDVLHVRYENLRESTRDRIYRVIFGGT